ncbi:hypothetical protein UPYG_G00046920 [Umbra pygmaea]|uniref:C2H2-type domain-containing protein n=1 Tax=Umbra pygmaea TaxID=75934 RepID=A0ABD0XSR2_UMBPY
MSGSVVDFQAQIASIMEVLANAAVAEICKVVDDGYAVVQLEMSQSHKENEFLRRKMKLMELQLARLRAERTKSSEGTVHNRFHGIRLLNRHNRDAATTGISWQNRARFSNRSFGNNSIQRDRQPIDVDQEDASSSKQLEASRDEQPANAAEEEPDLLIVKVEGEADNQSNRTSHPARTVEGSREINTQPAAATTEDPAVQPCGQRGNTSNSSMEAQSSTESERDLQPWKKKEGLGEMPGAKSGMRTTQSTLQPSSDTDHPEYTEHLRPKHRSDTVYKSDPEPESMSQVPEHTGPGLVVNQPCSLHSERTTDVPGNTRKRKCSETEIDRPSCSSYVAKMVSESPLALAKLNPGPVPQMVSGEQESSRGTSEVKSEFIVVDPHPVDEHDGGDESPLWRQGEVIEERHPQGGHSEADSLLLGGHSSNAYHHPHHTHPRVQIAARPNPPESLFYGIDLNGSFENRLDAFQSPATSTAAPFAAGSVEQQYPSWVDFEESAHLGDITGTHQDRGGGAEGARTYRCTFCGKEYPHLCQLKMHQRCIYKTNCKPLTAERWTEMERNTEDTCQLEAGDHCSNDLIQTSGLRKEHVEGQQKDEEARSFYMEVDPIAKHNYMQVPLPVESKTTSSPVKLPEDKLHVTVLQGTNFPPLQKCTSCCSFFHCPYCTFFKPAPKPRTLKHIKCHLSRAVRYNGYTMMRCTFTCRKVGHYHCPFCKKTILKKQSFLDHLKICRSLGEARSNVGPRCADASTGSVLAFKLGANSTAPVEASHRSDLTIERVETLQQWDERNKGLMTTWQMGESKAEGMELLEPIPNDENINQLIGHVGLGHVSTEGGSVGEDANPSSDESLAEKEGPSQFIEPMSKELPVTVLKGQTMPPLQRCTSCCKKYHCPFCTAFKPNTKNDVLIHLDTHISQAVFHDGYLILMCTSNCREDGHTHHHCPFCEKTHPSRSRTIIINHLRSCRGRDPGGTNADADSTTEEDHTDSLPTEDIPPFLTYSLTRNHCVKITPEKTIQREMTVCEHCGFVLHRRNLKKHLLRKHPEVATLLQREELKDADTQWRCTT